MIPAAFDYQRPANLEEALRILAEGHEGTKVINGGQSLLPLLKLRLGSADAFDSQSGRAEVVVRFTVTPTGEVSKLTLVSSNNARLNRSVLRAVQGWRYAPIATAREHNVSFAFTPQ